MNFGENVIDLVSSESSNGDDIARVDVDVQVLAIRHFVEITGKPKAWPRPTFMSWMKKGKMMRRVVNHASPQIKKFRETFKAVLMDRYGYNDGSFPLFDVGGVVMKIAFYRRMPNKAFTRRDRWRGFVGGCFSNESSWADTMKPDLDNLIKFVMDALQGVVYHDDDQVVKLVTYKLMDTEGQAEGRTQVAFHAVNRMKDLPHNPLRVFYVDNTI
jgi:Holliday junction resolvase RusA-like endonuclease